MRLGREWNENEKRSTQWHCGKHTAGERAACCRNMNPDHSIWLSRSESAATKCRVFPPSQKCILHWQFLLDKTEILSQIFFLCLCFNDSNSLWNHLLCEIPPNPLTIPWILLTCWDKIHMAAHALLRNFQIRGCLLFQTISWLFSGATYLFSGANHSILLSINLLSILGG